MRTPKFRAIAINKRGIYTQYRPLSTGIGLSRGRYVAPGAKITTQSAANRLSAVSQSYLPRHKSTTATAHLRLVSDRTTR